MQEKNHTIIRVIFLMITSGIIRKIDELGRIVLPKEIRKTLNINPGDDFQITIQEDKIILQRFQRLKNIESEILKIIDPFILINNYKIYLVIGNQEIISNRRIIDNLEEIIQERKIYIQENIGKIQLFENQIDEGRLVILPLVKDSDLLGSIIIVSNDKTNEMVKTSKIIEILIKNILDHK